MKLSKFTVILAILLISIMAIGAVSAESVDDSTGFAIDEDVGEVQESVEPTEVAEDVSTADDAAVATVDDDGSAVLGDDPKEYDLDDDTYSTYFKEDGTPTEVINESSDYTLNVGTLNNKDIKITYGNNIHIKGKEGAGFINNGTIALGNGLGEASMIQITGLTFTNTNKDAIYVNENSTMVAIADNVFNLNYDANYMDSPMAIAVFGQVYGTHIQNNNIKMVSAASYSYGIDISNYLPAPTWNQGASNAEEIFVRDNVINITSTASSGMVEAMYIDSVVNSEFVNNTIYTYSGEGVANYGMALADSWGYTVMSNLFNDSYIGGYSPYNVLIDDNKINIESGDMAYAITAISWFNTDEWYDEIIKNIVISHNDVNINSEKGAVGIGAQSSDVKITDNKVSINADYNAQVTANPDPVFGDDSNAITILNYNQLLGYYYNTTVTDNIITTNVPAIFIDKTKGNSYYSPEPIVIEDNTVTYTGAVEYTIDDDHYFLFFNADGTPTDLLNPAGNYTLFIDTLNGKDIKIPTGNSIYIANVEGAGIINNGSITIGNDVDEMSKIFINGLTFNNFDKNGITVLQNVKDSSIAQNTFNLTFDDSIYWPAPSPAAITVLGYVDDIRILGNKIDLTSDSTYSYGITLAAYGNSGYGPKNAEHLFITGNILNVVYNVNSGMGEGIYLDTIANSEISNNKITVETKKAGASNYGIQVADSSSYDTTHKLVSPYNVTIGDNDVTLNSADMAYGITVISTTPSENSKDMEITNNNINVVSETGAIGIGAVSSDVYIKDNTVTLTADPTKEVKVYVDAYFGNISYGIFINNKNDFGTFNNTTVIGNTINTNIEAIKVAEEEDEGVKPLVIEDNDAHTSYLIDEDNYATYFNTDGTIKADAPFKDGDVLLLGDLTGKKFVINSTLTINGVPGKKLVDSTIKLVKGADGSVIDGVTIEYTGLKSGAITLSEVSDVKITNNIITVPSTTQTVYGIAIDSGDNGCHDILIANNVIDITGSRYVYGIDIWEEHSLSTKHSDISIVSNNITLVGTGTRMAQGIYASEIDNAIIYGNSIKVTSGGAAYGVGTDYLTNSDISNNNIEISSSGQMAYGITATTSGSDITISNNDVKATGIGAVGVGINNQTGAEIADNTIDIEGGDYTTITSSDSLGTANAGILVGVGNTDVEISGNDVTEKSAVRLDTAIEASDVTVTAAPSGNGNLEITLKTVSGMLLANQTVKVVFDNKVTELTTDDNGVARLPFALNKAGTYNVDIFYLGDDNYRGADATAKVTINKIATKLTSAAKTYLATAKTKSLTATLKDANGKALANKKVTFTVNGKTVTATTNAKGVATAKLALTAAKTYTVTIKFAGDGVYAASTVSAKVKLNKEKTKVTAPKKTFKKSKKVKKVVITLKNSKGKAIAKKKVTLTVNKKKYTAKTNKKGKATFKVKNLKKKGTFKYKVKFAGDTQYKASKKTGKIKVK